MCHDVFPCVPIITCYSVHVNQLTNFFSHCRCHTRPWRYRVQNRPIKLLQNLQLKRIPFLCDSDFKQKIVDIYKRDLCTSDTKVISSMLKSLPNTQSCFTKDQENETRLRYSYNEFRKESYDVNSLTEIDAPFSILSIKRPQESFSCT